MKETFSGPVLNSLARYSQYFPGYVLRWTKLPLKVTAMKR
jgi:hypothetical protein